MSVLRAVSSVLMVVMLGGVMSAHQTKTPAAQPVKTASQFYLDFRVAFDKAKKMEDLMPWVTAAQRKAMEETPDADRKQMFDMLKVVAKLTNVKVTKETPQPDGSVTLTAEAIDPDKHKSTGTIQIVKENGAWKVGVERWQ